MKIDGEYTFEAAPRRLVWSALHDTTVLAGIMPGCEKLEPVGNDTYKAVMKVKVGPVQGVFDSEIALAEINEPNSYKMNISGQGTPGFVKANANVQLEESGADTIMRYQSDAQIGGKLASVGQRLVETSAKAIIRQSLEGLQQTVAAKVEAAKAAEAAGAAEEEALAAAAAAPVELKGVSQADYAKSVAKEVASELLPTPVLIIGGLVIAAVVAYLVLNFAVR